MQRDDKKYKLALITGGSSGIGFSFAKALAETGADIIIISKNNEKLSAARLFLEKEYKVHIYSLQCDLSKQDNIDNIFKFLDENHLEPDLLINNAGEGIYGSFSETDEERELTLINLNIVSVMLLSKKMISRWLANNQKGTIINVSSTLAFRKSPAWSVYAAAKAFILSFSGSISHEYGKSPVDISVLCPGKTDTNFDDVAGKFYTLKAIKESPDFIARYTLKKLMIGKRLIIPGIKNKIKYLVFRLFPEFLTDKLIPKE